MNSELGCFQPSIASNVLFGMLPLLCLRQDNLRTGRGTLGRQRGRAVIAFTPSVSTHLRPPSKPPRHGQAPIPQDHELRVGLGSGLQMYLEQGRSAKPQAWPNCSSCLGALVLFY